MGIADVLARAHAQVSTVGAVTAVAGGLPCGHIPGIPQAWATQARAMAGPPEPGDLAEAIGWLRAHSPSWTVASRGEDAASPVFGGLSVVVTLPAYVLDAPPPEAGTPLDIGPARDPGEFLAVYGAELAPLVTPAHLAAPDLRYLVGRLDGIPVACARVARLGPTAQVSGVAVLPEHRGQGFGTAISAAATRLAGTLSDTVWLHATPTSAPVYMRLGYRYVADHVLLGE